MNKLDPANDRRREMLVRLREGTQGTDIAKTDPYLNSLMSQAADCIAALDQKIEDLNKLAHAAYCEGFYDGKDGGWIVGPTDQPWKASDAHKALVVIKEHSND